MIHSEFHTATGLRNLHKGVISQNVRFLVRSIEFNNPQCQDSLLKYSKFHSKNDQTIAGSYIFETPLSSSSTTTSTHKKNPTFSQDDDSASLNETRNILNHNISNGTASNGSSAVKQCDCFKTLDKMESKYSSHTYIELMLDIIDYLPNLSHVILNDVEPSFKIPLWYSVFNDGSRDFFKKIIKGQQSITSNDLRTFQISKDFVSEYERKFYSLQRLKKLEIRATLDKRRNHQVYLRPNLLCCFGIINELVLSNVILDTESLDTPMEFLPLNLRKEESGLYHLHAPFHSLTLKSCHVIPGNGILRLFHSYFKCVKSLELLEITSKYDLLLCNCFPALTDLTIDCNSHCFTSEKLVDDEYYYEDIEKQLEQQRFQQHLMESSLHDCETLHDTPHDHILQAPPATSSVVLSLNAKYISRTTSDTKNQKNHRKPATLTKSQGEYFNHLRIPEFHYFYHYYKLLWDRLPHQNININVINIPFTNVYPLSPTLFWDKMLNLIRERQQLHQGDNDEDTADQETLIAYRNDHGTSELQSGTEMESHLDTEQEYYWDSSVKKCFKDNLQLLKDSSSGSRSDNPLTVIDIDEIIEQMDNEIINNFQNFQYFKDIPNINLWCFFKSLSKFKSVRIRLLRNLLFCTPRTRYDWELLLRPVLRVNVPIEVRDKDGFVLYSYGVNNKNKKRR